MTTAVDDSAREQAAAWLALADTGDARGTWDAAGRTFQSSITLDAWGGKLQAARAPLGPLTSRVEAVAQQLDGLPGAPPGEYVVMQYHSVYDARAAVVETLTLQREPDGIWRVVGYFIR